jgi:tetratricopeptide (TPR) repeat protein
MNSPLLSTNVSMPSLCLNMIVKNESRVILRLLESVFSIIDCYCICDTGSTDNTQEIIQEFFQEKWIPGKILKHEFVNFEYSRNFALKACEGMSDYILFLDADMILQIGTQFDKTSLSQWDSFTLLQGTPDFYYKNLRIVKNNGLYSYKGVTHEYLQTPQNNTTFLIKKEDLFILDLGDGGSKQDKFQRDIRLLLKGLKSEPLNDRYHFYLANSYHDSGNYEKAIQVYEKRIQMGGWEEEVWYSYYKIGHCYKNMGQNEKAIASWLNAYNQLPERVEALYEIISYYRILGKHKVAHLFYKIAKDILDNNNPRDDYLFLHNDIYTYKIDYEYTILAAYLKVHSINDEVICVLNVSQNDTLNCNLLSNMKFYKQVLPAIQTICLDESTTIDFRGKTFQMVSSSSCMIENVEKNGYCMNIRYVNYFIDESNGNYLGCEQNIITVNTYVELNKECIIQCKKSFAILDNKPFYVGVDDIRLFRESKTNNILFTGTEYHTNNKLGVSWGKYESEKETLVSKELQQNWENTDCEKNWVYVEYKEKTHVVYKWFPLQLCKIDETGKNLILMETRELPRFFSRVRGSSCGFTCKNREIWFVGHIVSYEKPRHYYHILSVFDENMNLLRYSAPFSFEGKPVEYCLSIIVEEERVLMNYSTWDKTTRIGVYDKKIIESLLQYK